MMAPPFALDLGMQRLPEWTQAWPLKRWAASAMLLVAGWDLAQASLLAEGQVLRSIPYTVRDGHKPMLAARVAGQEGVVMLDNGTPDALLLNRDAAPLPPGRFVARGAAASGQTVEVHQHPAPSVAIDGLPLPLADTVRSGNFQFTVAGLGADFLGFVGTPMLAGDAFVLDPVRQRLVLLRVAPGGELAIAPPAPRDVRVTVPFFLWPGEQPTVAGALGPVPLLIDLDTGDEGTLYLTAATKQQLQRQRLLQPRGASWQVAGLRIGGVAFAPLTVRLVDAGGSDDHRKAGRADQLRLGAHFLAQQPCLWNFPARTLTFLKPQAAFLADLADTADKTQSARQP
jgi:hypothetical protein